MSITLDIAGFYYQADVEFRANLRTVLDVMNELKGESAPNGGVLDFRLDQRERFLEELIVEYPEGASPTSRQRNLSGLPIERPVGRYGYRDNVRDPSNRIVGADGGVSGLLTWQYYIFDKSGTLQTRTGDDGGRYIVPCSSSNDQQFGTTLRDGDRIVWRLIAIFGLNEIVDAAASQAQLSEEFGDRPVGLKRAIGTIGDRLA